MATAAAKAPVGMERADLKRMLKLAHKGPIHAAFALGGDGKPIIVLDKMKQPRALEKGIKDQAPDAKNSRWGTVSIDENDPKLARFVVNKAASGFARKLVIALKGTGCSKVEIVLEDGTAVESCEGEPDEDQQSEAAEGGAADDGDAEGGSDGVPPSSSDPTPANGTTSAAPSTDTGDADGSAPQAPASAGGPGPQPPAGPSVNSADNSNGTPPPPSGQDAAGLMAALTALVKQLMPIAAADPTQRDALKGIVGQAQASLNGGDLQTASRHVDDLRAMLTAGGSQVAPPAPPTGGAQVGQATAPAAPVVGAQAGATPGSPTPPAQTAPAKPAAPQITKARTAWVATRQKLEKDLGGLHDAFGSAFKGHDKEADLVKAFRSRVDTVLNTLDEKLSHKLDELNNATDTAQRGKLVQEAQRILQDYEKHVSSDQTIAALDSNPFVPMSIQKTMNTTLAALSKAIR